MRMGDINRSIGMTKNNDRSSRSHTIFTITIERLILNPASELEERVTKSVINLVDLAGCESI